MTGGPLEGGMRIWSLLLVAALAFLLVGCGPPDGETATSLVQKSEMENVPSLENPAAPGFDAAGSDERAISIADSVVWAYGGRRAYDQNRYFEWDFLGVRNLVWDKRDQRVRIEFPAQQATYLLDYGDMSGRARLGDHEVTDPDSLALALAQARSIWINDSYWLVHAFKLKDTGVTLRYAGAARDPERSRPSYVIEQTFTEVGDTPQNRYRLYVDRETYRINTWQFFRDAADEEVALQTPWRGEENYNGVVLSSDRGERFQLKNIGAPTQVPEATFTEF